MHCDLYIPDFFSAEEFSPADGLAAAETLIARGRRRRVASVSPEAWLFGRFGVERQRDWPVAPYTLLADGGAPERHFWMRADPVHLRVGRDSLVLADGVSFFQVQRDGPDVVPGPTNRKPALCSLACSCPACPVILLPDWQPACKLHR